MLPQERDQFDAWAVDSQIPRGICFTEWTDIDKRLLFAQDIMLTRFILARAFSMRIEDSSQSYLIFVIFFTQAKFLENKIYTEIYTVNCQFTQ